VLTLKAHAKINLGLHVTAKRPDGYHEIDTLFVRLALHDTLTLQRSAAGVTLKVQGAQLPEGPDNLAYRAAERYLQTLPYAAGVDITLIKALPIAAGLGGGSSDAAAVLVGLAQLYPAAVPLMELAGELGSDVPFFVSGYSAARGKGRGEQLTPVQLPTCYVVVVNPGIRVSAAEAYASLRRLQTALPLSEILGATARGKAPLLYNGLQAGVIASYPAIAEVLDALTASGLTAVLMSGSGASCFGLAPSLAQAQQAAQAVQQSRPEWWVRASQTV
jgi:4-diphosphocytidyl-2-C-methyl-D-erythritol kinase